MSGRSEAVRRRVAAVVGTAIRRSRDHQVELALLVVALLPVIVAVVRALTTGWIPLGDGAYFVARSRDVLTDHHPLVGALSSGSTATDTTVNNLGPLQLDLLAPFTKLDQHWGAAVGVGALNAAAVVGVWLTARRLFGLLGLAGVMLATIGLELTIGSALLIDARQQVTLLLPLWCLLWLTTAMGAGHIWALPWAAFTASLLLQTHLSYSYLTAALTITASILLIRHLRRNWRQVRAGRWVLATAGVLTVCWAQTAWDQLFDTGNFTTAMGAADTSGVGTSMAMRVVGDSVFVPPFWAPGSISSYMASDLINEPSVSTAAGVAAIALWAAMLIGVLVVERRWHHGVIRVCAQLSLVGLGAAMLTATRIPTLPTFGLAPQNYFWMWPLGAFFTVTIVAGLLLGVTRARAQHRAAPEAGSGRRPAPRAGLAVAAVAALVSVLGFQARDYWPQAPYETGFARDVISELRDTLDDQEIDGPVVMPFFWGIGVDGLNYTLLTELQDHGIEYVFPSDTPNVERFGRNRCMSGTERHLLRTVNGESTLDLAGNETLLAFVDELPAAEADELVELDVRFGDRLRDGSIDVDLGAARYFGSSVPPELPGVLETPSAPATGLAVTLDRWTPWGIVSVPDDLAREWDRWVELQRRANGTRLAIILSPNDVTGPERTC